MFDESELKFYARAEASNMGLKKTLDIRVNQQLFCDYYRRTSDMHEIRLTSLNRSTLRHELGHAYISERLPKLYKFFSIILQPIDVLIKKFGVIISSMVYTFVIGINLYGILYANKNGLTAIVLILILNGVILCVPLIDEVMAIYFGKKYEPAKYKKRHNF